MTSQIIPVEPFDYVVFGGTGDLARRKLLPALFRRAADGQIVGDSRIVAVARSELDDTGYRELAADALNAHLRAEEKDPAAIGMFLQRLHYIQADAGSPQGWNTLRELLGPDRAERRVRAFYLAVGPSLFGGIANRIDEAGLITPDARLVIEKPIGNDLASAQALNRTVGAHFSEDQIYRIDHYLGKETVQNLMALRFANALYEPIWNAAHIDHVQITVAETLGVEGRAEYYDRAGAVRDMVQNHLLQLLCLVAMEPPSSMDADAVRDEKLKVLRSLEPIGAGNAEHLTVRGQYEAGAVNGEAVQGYHQALSGKDTQTETFVAIKAEIGNWRWSGVPFYLRTGKRLARRVSEIVIRFKPVPHNIFSADAGRMRTNLLVLRLQPDEAVSQMIMIKDPGPGGMRLRQVALDMSFADRFDTHVPDAYERLLLDVVRGNATLFMRRDEVEAAWAWIDPIADAWRSAGVDCRGYTAGSWGPSSAIALIERDGRTWHEDYGGS